MLKIIGDSLDFIYMRKKFLRSLIRGYFKLKNDKKLDYILTIRKLISRTKLKNDCNSEINSFFLGASDSNIQLSIHQFLLTRLINIDLNRKILSFISTGKKIFYPLPKEWRRKMIEENIMNDSIINKIYWNLYIITIFCYGILINFKRLLFLIFYFFYGNKIETYNGVYFHKLKINNLPIEDESGVINWYDKVFGIHDKNKFYFHDVNTNVRMSINTAILKYLKYPFQLKLSFKQIIGYVLWYISCIFYSIFEYFKGNYIYMLLFHDASLAYLYRNSSTSFKKILIHQTGYLYKPLWTYEAEKLGTDVVLYFYGTNIQNIKFKNKDFIQDNFWEYANWKKYYAWDKSHYQFLNNNLNNFSDIDIIGPVDFISNNRKILCSKSLSIIENNDFISIFDVQPQRESFYYSLGNEVEYYVVDTAINFLNDICNIALKYNFTVVHKRKRKNEEHKIRNLKYIKHLSKLCKKRNFYSVDPDISANMIIDKSKLVISMPFTSTALYARSKNIPTIFYDPTSKIDRTFHKFDDIDLICGKNELEAWFKKI